MGHDSLHAEPFILSDIWRKIAVMLKQVILSEQDGKHFMFYRKRIHVREVDLFSQAMRVHVTSRCII